MADSRRKPAQFRSRNPVGWEGESDLAFNEQGATRVPGPIGSSLTPAARTPACLKFMYLPDLGPSDEMSDAPPVCVQTAVCAMRPEGMRVLAWMREYRQKIADAERTFRIDRRAIAGAIGWEAIENPHKTNRSFMRTSVGKGKIHVRHFSHGMPSIFGVGDFVAKQAEDRGYVPTPASDADRIAILATNEGAITYIAAIMSAGADVAATYGFQIRCDPPLLAQFYHSKDLNDWEALLKAKPIGSALVAGTDMALWVQSNMAYLEDGVGPPDVRECAGAAVGTRLQ